jgi:hypothetical protein
VLRYLWRDLQVRECQLDELWSFVHTKEDHLPWPSSTMKPMVMLGSGWHLRRCGA